MNRLANEKSPYLLQHVHNPVDWFAWGPEAFEKARAENKPIFLSIGYSTCHWCHVMERESFENDKIAELLNRDYVAIKVDREERPDVDRIYMTFVQATTGSGGWPMSVWLTPELKPFFGGTYFPPENRWGSPGFASVLTQIAGAWRSDREKIDESARDVVEQLKKSSAVEGRAGGGRIDAGILDSGFSVFRRTFDTRLGGFGGAPKFPRPSVHHFLLRYYARTKNHEALDMVLLTLREMAKGGMNDQLGGGFHRYSVDERWFVPHFEKMLYDQGQLVTSYLEALQITGDEQYAETARRTLDYVLRDMTDPGGAFYSAEDADSVIDPAHPHEKGEGAFYIWTADEIRGLLGETNAEAFMRAYGVRDGGNVEHDPHGEFTGKNILYLAGDGVLAPGADALSTLLQARGKRPRPHLDDKILTGWNGLMISAFALGGAVLNEPRYAEAARRATEFILEKMYAGGKLLRRYRAGEAAIPAFLDDYALFVQALLDLYDAQFDVRHLQLATDLTLQMRDLFEDPEHGGFFSSPAGDESLVMRVKDDYDGAEPSGNSVALMNLLRLTQMTNRDEFRQSAARTLAAFEKRLSLAPSALPQMLAACEFLLSHPRQIVVAGGRESEDTKALLRAIHARFIPNRVALLIDSEETRARLAQSVPEIAAMQSVDGRAAAYVCRDYACQLPVTNAAALAELLQ
ncbi:MAG: thioredoxin domain-containing protein [Bryobacteraceae bacterium]